jgi:DNA-binding transcriptional LysR family regulator
MDSDDALIDVKLLRLFDLLYSTRSVTRCAEQLGHSQPSISMLLARLRKLLADPLFVRLPSGMHPTPRADALIGSCRRALEVIRELSADQSEFAPSLSKRTFRICMTDASHITTLPRLFSRLTGIAPFVRLEAIRIDNTTATQLESGDADLAFGFLPELESGFYQQKVYDQDWICVVGPEHPRIRRVLRLNSYQREAHVAVAVGTGHLQLDAQLKKANVDRRVLLQLPGFLGLPAILRNTELVATLPRMIAETLAKDAGLRTFECPVRVPPYAVRIHWHARYHYDLGHRWLRALICELFQRHDVHAIKAVKRS